jgi:Reverse transcriptase (RNA-dependent DNA polymerase).
MLLTIAGNKRMFVYHYDVKTAFLYGNLTETVLMKQPEGFVVTGNEHMVCKLNKSIYGLKQAAKLWNEKLHEVLKQNGYEQGKTDPCLYVKITEKETTYLICYVDDIIIASNQEDMIFRTGEALSKHFQLTNLGKIRHYLGIQIEQDAEGFFNINQLQYINNVLTSSGLEDAKTSKIPLDVGYEKSRENDEYFDDDHTYRKFIGKLLYIAVNTRPDIAASVSILSQHNVKPKKTDWNEVKRVIKYLKGTKQLTLKLGSHADRDNNSLIGYADADWAQSRTDRKSNSGYVFKFKGGTISWACKKQNCVALSTTEAEYVALAEACQEGTWIQKLLEDFGEYHRRPITIMEDNQGCLKLSENKKFSSRTKHIATKYHYVRELKEKGIMEYKYCPTELMVADLLTKPLNNIKLTSLRLECGLSKDP